MHILVDAAKDEELVVVPHGLAPIELLGLLQRALLFLDLALLCVEHEAVRDPAVVSSEDEDLGVIESKAAHGVSRTPVALATTDLKRLPALLIEVRVSIKLLEGVERGLLL